MQLVLNETARAALRRLRDDPAAVDLYLKCAQTVAWIRDNADQARARRRGFETDQWGRVWVVPVQSAPEWIVVWSTDDPDVVHVRYVGPGPGEGTS